MSDCQEGKSNLPEIFQFKGKEIRTLTDKDGNVLLGATETAIALGYKNPHDAINRHCKARGVVKHEVPHPQSQCKFISMTFITEPNVYRLVAHSKLPSAEKFESWIFETVIPSIRKNGGYINPGATVDQVNTMIKAWEKERNSLIDTIKEQAGHIELLTSNFNKATEAINFMKPKKPYGEISEVNGLPKDIFVVSHFKSNPKNTRSQHDAIQLLLPLFEVIMAQCGMQDKKQ